MRRFLLLMTMLTVLASPALAAFTVKISAPDEMFAGDSANVTVTVSNTGSDGMFTISQVIAPPEASQWSNLQGSMGTVIPYGKNGTFVIRLSPSNDAKPGMYSFALTLTEQSTNERVQSTWSTTVRQHVAAAVIRVLNLTCTECRGSGVDFTVSVENVGTTTLKGFKVSMSGPGQQTPLELGDVAVGATKALQGSFNLAGVQPGSYQVRAQLVNDASQVADARSVSFTIPLIEDVEMTTGGGMLPWSKTVSYTATNKGNAQDEAVITATSTPSPWVSISFSQEPSERNGNNVVWKVSLAPGTSSMVSYTEFYWPVPIIIVAVIVGMIYAYFWATALVLRKKVTKRDGEWTVSLTAINRGGTVDGVVVRDMVPAGLRLGTHFETLRPITRATAGGTELVWRVGGMRKGEQRVLHYRMIGDRAATLPNARLSAKRGEKTIISSSASINLPGVKAQPKLTVATEN